MATSDIQVYKNEDINSPEYATLDEVQQAFFGRGVFIKNSNGGYEQALAYRPEFGTVTTHYGSYRFTQHTD